MYDLKLLEYPKILNLIKEYSTFNKTKDRILTLTPLNNKGDIYDSLKLVEDALNSLYRSGDLELYNYELNTTLDRIRIKSLLNISEFLELYKLCLNTQYLKNYYIKIEETENSSLDNYFNNLNELKELKNLILNVMDSDGNIVDSASEKLYSIRKEIKKTESEINKKLNDLLKTLSSKLSESIITVRNGHKVIPIKSDFKAQVKGIIYDESSSGQTSYIEPYEVAELEGKVILLKNEEKDEISNILDALSKSVSLYYDEISNNDYLINELDFIFSKAKYAKKTDSTMPLLDNKINLINARHPLINKEKVVRNTISLDNKKSMIITGPNTGGKTVILKTVGLLTMLAQTGILIPVDNNSSIKIFDNVFADIGDEQSIEQSLSTFSSHMKRIVDITNNVNENSLVLLDELGSGTDPKEGASLAVSIVNYLKNKNSTFIVTTHYPELKMYAYNNIDILNASVEFDTLSLKPTYKLLIGVSGKSNAFLISKKLGLNESILNDAIKADLEFKDSNSALIEKLEEESISLNKEKEMYNSLVAKLKEEKEQFILESTNIKKELQKEKNSTINERNEILLKAQDEATLLLDEIKTIKKSLDKNENIKDNVIAELRGKTNSLLKDKSVNRIKTNETILLNDYVRIIELNQVGQVIKISSNKYHVQIGSFNSIYKKDELEKVEVIDPVKYITKKQSSSFNYALSNRLDLRGMRYEEAKDKLDKFIDEAIMSNLETVDIIHGYGTLSLMKMVQEYAKTHDEIKEFRYGDEHEGGKGVTVFKLK